MKVVTMLLLAVCGVSAIAQDMMAPIPKELDKVDAWVGTWVGREKLFDPSGQTMESDSTMVYSKTLNGRYLEGKHTSTIMGQKVEGLHMMTYDPERKAYVAWWFDSAAPGAMEMEGNHEGTKLVMTGKPVSIPGMTEKQTFKAEWDMKDNDTVTFLLSLKTGDTWTKVIEGEFKRKK